MVLQKTLQDLGCRRRNRRGAGEGEGEGTRQSARTTDPSAGGMAPKLALLLALLPCVRAQASADDYAFSVTVYDSPDCTGNVLDTIKYSGVQVGECATDVGTDSAEDGTATYPSSTNKANGFRAVRFFCDTSANGGTDEVGLIETDYHDDECSDPWTYTEGREGLLRAMATSLHTARPSASTSDYYRVLDEYCRLGITTDPDDDDYSARQEYFANTCKMVVSCDLQDGARALSSLRADGLDVLIHGVRRWQATRRLERRR